MDIGLVFRGLEEDRYDSFTINMKNKAKTISLSCFISGLMGFLAHGSCKRGKAVAKRWRAEKYFLADCATLRYNFLHGMWSAIQDNG
ncbi:MAG: hypothetical protein D9V46_08735 [Deltaproteobacteria bacterium]|uniref:hypothetical protein n=1 Tax=Hydrosulfovibrio ferrireducens TaxID=2934181 RepID=UPI001212B220|nr:MAG: hypothetical protein D9V46_08735 [Deltaproteobacteria bacterium]